MKRDKSHEDRGKKDQRKELVAELNRENQELQILHAKVKAKEFNPNIDLFNGNQPLLTGAFNEPAIISS